MLLTAPLIHDGYGFLPPGTVIETDDNGLVLAIHPDLQTDAVMHHRGLLCPGFVNVHCHLELSHMKGMIPEHTGLMGFLSKVPSHRAEFTGEQVKAARHEAYFELLHNGVVAAGDIANVTDTIDLRQLDKLHLHTFVECLGFTETHARERYEAALAVYEAFAGRGGDTMRYRQSIVPHAPYSVSKTVFELIDKHRPHALLSIHNQESDDEDEFYRQGTGGVTKLLAGFGIDTGFFEYSGKSSLQTYTGWLSSHHHCIFVHNTRASAADVAVAENRFASVWWCLCPNANLYIENRLPDVPMLAAHSDHICIGTDSLASNHQLCILSELLTLHTNFPDIGWEKLIRWATLNGARALGMDEIVGSIAPGRKPGILNIIPARHATEFPRADLSVAAKPEVQRII